MSSVVRDSGLVEEVEEGVDVRLPESLHKRLEESRRRDVCVPTLIPRLRFN